MGSISYGDEKIIADLRRTNVLQDPVGHLLDLKNGSILVTCSDADYFFSILCRQLKMILGQRHNARIHPLCMNGGPIRLVPNSPANKRPDEHLFYQGEILDAMKMKGIKTIALVVHAPCGKAAACNIDLLYLLKLLVQAKLIVKKMDGDVVVVCYIHVAFPNKDEHTYFFSRPDWEEWIA